MSPSDFNFSCPRISDLVGLLDSITYNIDFCQYVTAVIYV